MCVSVSVCVCVCVCVRAHIIINTSPHLYSNQQILVCAPSNTAVDQLTEKIHKTGIKVNQ